MGVIRVLPEQVANQIAAGEVVERPASVVKELLENALDAGASRIDVVTEGGGADLIRVADNGSGMSRDDARLAFERHATSKIDGANDLTSIRTLGFRGEALPSIASVSRLTLTTSTGASSDGSRVRVRGGEIVGVEPASHPRGTTVEVEGLFGNAPARRKFLRSKTTEAAHIADLLARIAAAYPAIAFGLRSDGRDRAIWPAVPSYRERIAQILGGEEVGELLQIERQEGVIRVLGLASRPALQRSTARHVIFFVNARPVRDRRLLHAVQEAYTTLLPRGRYPVAYLYLEIPPDQVDVNVHPAKSEVRFLRAGAVHDLVRDALLEAHGVARPFYTMSEPASRLAEGPPWPVSPPRAAAPSDPVQSGPAAAGAAGSAAPAAVDAGAPASTLFIPDDLTPLAQFHDTYIVASSPAGLVILDQHAAHERILYERLLDDARNGRVERQRLLFPVTVEVSAAQHQILDTAAGTFEALGFALVPFGPGALRVDEVPAMIPAAAVTRLLRDMLDEIIEWDRAEGAERLRARMAATSACHAAVRANQTLGKGPMQQIVDDIMRARQPMTCPHGRPTLLRLPLERIEREFLRR